MPERRIAMRGDDGHSYHFLIQMAPTATTRADERIMQVRGRGCMEKRGTGRRRNREMKVNVLRGRCDEWMNGPYAYEMKVNVLR